MNSADIFCPINDLPAKQYTSKGRAEYYIEPIDGIIFQSTLPTVSEMEEFNQNEYKQGRYRAYFEMAHLKKRTAELRLNVIKQYGKDSGRLLDVGCSVGFFLCGTQYIKIACCNCLLTSANFTSRILISIFFEF
jgi:hypothetical protein